MWKAYHLWPPFPCGDEEGVQVEAGLKGCGVEVAKLDEVAEEVLEVVRASDQDVEIWIWTFIRIHLTRHLLWLTVKLLI